MSSSVAFAQETKPHPDMSKPGAKDPYISHHNWDGDWCCNGHDCEQAVRAQDFKPIDNGYLVVPTGEVVPMGKTGISKDGNWHICRRSDVKKTIRCLLVPNGGV